MLENTIRPRVNRANTNLVIWNLLLAIAVLVAAGLNASYLKTFFSAPAPISESQLAAIGDPSQVDGRLVVVSGEEIMDSGIQEIQQMQDEYSHQAESETVQASFYALRLENRLLVVRSPRTLSSPTVTGILRPLPAEVRQNLLKDAPPGAEQLVLPVMVDTGDFRMAGYLGLTLGLLALALAVWNLTLGFRRMMDPGTHPVYRSLERFGNPMAVAREIDADLQGGSEPMDRLLVGQQWMLIPSSIGLEILKLDELAWIYKKVTRHYVNFIPTGKSYAAVICTVRRRVREIHRSEAEVEQLLVELVRRVPWVLAGHDSLIAAQWAKNPEAINTAIAERRFACYQAQQAQADDPGAATMVKPGDGQSPMSSMRQSPVI